MERNRIFLLKDGEGKSFAHDPNLPPLPLPKLEDTLKRYYESLKPFGTPAELEISRRIILDFQNGIGKTLHELVERKSWTDKNWANKWWENYRYHLLRYPLYPYVAMVVPLPLQSVGIPETKEYSLKAAARCLYHKIEFWDLLHRERVRPVAPPDGMKYFSMEVFKRFFCTSRIPGIPQDRIKSYFKTVSEGNCPTHGILIAKGRIFQFECVKSDGSLTSAQEILRILQYVRGVVNESDEADCVPVLTCDDRSSWTKNRKHLQELSVHNGRLLALMESSVVMASLDEHSPYDYSESSQLALAGGFHCKWADRSNIMVIHRNGKISLIGEPSAYDARCSISFAFFLLLSLLELGEPDWNQLPTLGLSAPVEHTFDLDQRLRTEIGRVLNDCDARRNEVVVSSISFNGYGRKFIAGNGLHWDSFMQMVLLWTYYKMHLKYPSTQEVILLRSFYDGHTDTLRALTLQACEFLQTVADPASTKKQILLAFRKAANSHTDVRSSIKSGDGFDRHLVALYCAAQDENYDVPDLFMDPLYERSGGHRKYSLVSSTSGFTIANAITAPMIDDGYGFYYSVTLDRIDITTTAFRYSNVTSAHKFSEIFCEILAAMKAMLCDYSASKL